MFRTPYVSSGILLLSGMPSTSFAKLNWTDQWQQEAGDVICLVLGHDPSVEKDVKEKLKSYFPGLKFLDWVQSSSMLA